MTADAKPHTDTPTSNAAAEYWPLPRKWISRLRLMRISVTSVKPRLGCDNNAGLWAGHEHSTAEIPHVAAADWGGLPPDLLPSGCRWALRRLQTPVNVRSDTNGFVLPRDHRASLARAPDGVSRKQTRHRAGSTATDGLVYPRGTPRRSAPPIYGDEPKPLFLERRVFVPSEASCRAPRSCARVRRGEVCLQYRAKAPKPKAS